MKVFSGVAKTVEKPQGFVKNCPLGRFLEVPDFPQASTRPVALGLPSQNLLDAFTQLRE